MSLPPAYLNEIELLNQEILKSQPTDVLQFCAHFFGKRLESQRVEFLLSFPISPSQFDTSESKMSGSTFPGRLGTNANPFGGKEQLSSGAISKVMEEDENDTITSPTTPSFGFSKGGGSAFGGSFGGDASGEGPPSSFKATSGEGFPAHYGMGRRTSVSAESLNPTASSNDNWTPPFHPKSEDQIARLKKSISGNFLFSHLDDEQSSQVLGALVEKPIPAKDIKVCKQILRPCSWKCHSSPLPVKKRCLLATDNHVLGYHSRRSRGLLLRS
jgi:cAMP-dependent protein kinase regulator